MSVANPVIRVDKFSVPQKSMKSFMALVEKTHGLLQQQPGFIRELILEQVDGASKFNIVTIAERQEQTAIERAQRVITEFHEVKAFKPKETMQRLGIEADFGNYQPRRRSAQGEESETD
ncbi:hypothetical protein [Kangiella shandongensis]|uniref:hypothetical protein n=1 Tax=Kangiella shandongensis TaxID=2763258 RepID=UPI001CC1814C|nr:hypothetical protein [Kangiella shandongensis]